MNLLRMVSREKEKAVDLTKSPAIEPFTQSKGPIVEAWKRMERVLDKNEQIANRRERLLGRLAAFELRIEVLLDEVQRVKGKTN